jgi:hypothetical protein
MNLTNKWRNIMPEFTPELIAQTLNITFFTILGLSILFGLLRGFYKSLFFTIFSAIFLVAGFFLIPLVSEKILDANLGFINNILPSNIDVTVTSLRASLPEILANIFPKQQAAFAAGTDTMALAFGVVKFLLNIILLVVLLVLNATLFKIVPSIIWIFVKPKKDKATGEKPKKLRLFGALVGAVKGVVAVLFFAIPIAGLASFATSTSSLQNMIQDSSQAAMDDESAILESFTGYRNSIVGKTFSFTIGDTPFDEYLFDSFVKIDVQSSGTKETIKIRKDYNNLVEIFVTIVEANEGSLELNEKVLFRLTSEQLTSIQNRLKGTSLINVGKNVGAEFLHSMITEDNLIAGYEDEITLPQLKAINLQDDLSILVEAIKIINESDAQEEVFNNVFALSEAEAEELIDALSEMSLIKTGLPILFNLFLNMDSTKELMLDNNIDIANVVRPTPDDLILDFKNIVGIYKFAKDIGLTDTADFGQILDNEFLVTIGDEQVEDLFDVVFAFSFLYKNSELFSNFIYDTAIADLPDDFKDFLTREKVNENFNAAELSNLVLFVKVLAENEMFGEEDIDFQALLTDPNIEKLATHISKSNILSEGTETFINNLAAGFDLGFTIEVPDDVTFKENPGKVELTAFFKSIRDISNLELTDSESFGNLTEPELTALSTNFSNSKIITHNLSPLINSFTEGTPYDFINSQEEKEFWTQAEIYNTFNGIRIISNKGLDDSNIYDLSEAEIHSLALSKTISNAIENLLVNKTSPGEPLAGKLVINEGLVYESTATETGEVEHLFKGLNLLLAGSNLDSFAPEVNELLNLDLEVVFASKILEATLVENHIKNLFESGNLEKYLVKKYQDDTEFDWYIDENPNNKPGDTVPLLDAFKVLNENGIDYQTMNYNQFIVAVGDPEKPQQLNDAIISSNILTASLGTMLNQLLNVEANFNLEIYNDADLSYWGTAEEDGELFYILDGLVVAEGFKSYDYTALDDDSAADFKADAKQLNRSDTYRQLLARIPTESTLTIANSLRSDVDPKDLTKEEWDDEIDILTDVIVILNNHPNIDFDNPVLGDIAAVNQIKNLISNSLLYDASKIGYN